MNAKIERERYSKIDDTINRRIVRGTINHQVGKTSGPFVFENRWFFRGDVRAKCRGKFKLMPRGFFFFVSLFSLSLSYFVCYFSRVRFYTAGKIPTRSKVTFNIGRYRIYRYVCVDTQSFKEICRIYNADAVMSDGKLSIRRRHDNVRSELSTVPTTEWVYRPYRTVVLLAVTAAPDSFRKKAHENTYFSFRVFRPACEGPVQYRRCACTNRRPNPAYRRP